MTNRKGRCMSFMLTTQQILNETKTVTRRIGWLHLKPGDIIRAAKKCMGLKKGEKIEVLKTIRVVNVDREPVNFMLTDIEYGFEEVIKEGFADHPTLNNPEAWVAWFCEFHKIKPTDLVTRIEFEYVKDEP